MPKKIDEAVFTAVEALWGWGRPVYVRERRDKVLLSSEDVLWRTCRPVLSAKENR